MKIKTLIGAIEVTTTPKLLVDEDRNRKRLEIYNNGSATVELLSSKDQKYGDGMPTPTGANREYKDHCTAAHWIVAESGTQDVRVRQDIQECE